MLFVSLFRMRTADDLRNQLQMFKNDIDNHYKLLVPEIRNGLVLYIHTDLANLKMQETVRLVSKLVPTGDTNLKALSKSITRLLTTVKDIKKHLNRTWDKFISYLNKNFTMPLNSSSTSHVLSLPHCTSSGSGHTSCPASYSLNSDCHKCANRRIGLRRMFASNIALKTKLSHICDSINSIITTYATYHRVDYLLAKSSIIKHLKNTLSDRVAVNHCVVQQLKTAFEIELLELKCNIHPLDGIAK